MNINSGKFSEKKTFMALVFRRWASTTPVFKPERPEEIRQLLRPIGLVTKPLPNAEQSPTKTLQERKAEFMDVKRNRLRREELKEEFKKSSFEDIYKFRHTGGKIFTAPPKPFSKEESLYMINVHGNRLDDSMRSESSLAHLLSSTKPNLVRLFSSALGRSQIEAFTPHNETAALGLNLVDVNIPTSWINRLLVKWFSSRIRKSEIHDPKNHKYLLANGSLSKSEKSAIYATNQLAGYLYVVDRDGKIRWATSGPPIGDEKQRLMAILEELRTVSSE